ASLSQYAFPAAASPAGWAEAACAIGSIRIATNIFFMGFLRWKANTRYATYAATVPASHTSADDPGGERHHPLFADGLRERGDVWRRVCGFDRTHPASGIDGTEIRRVGLRDGEQVLAEMIAVVLGAHRLEQLVVHLAPPLDHVKRLVERLRIFDHH